ncbi:hypothetical protein V2I01_38005 [Micromonospora sp. BRA006-A]|nr:hypothetical protein [Micromonospora sp. BRA006-A]
MRIVEVPITFAEREHGDSKMSPLIVAEALWRVTRWGCGTAWRPLPPARTRSRAGLEPGRVMLEGRDDPGLMVRCAED